MGFVPNSSVTTHLLANLRGLVVALRARIDCTVNAHFHLLYVKIFDLLQLTTAVFYQHSW